MDAFTASSQMVLGASQSLQAVNVNFTFDTLSSSMTSVLQLQVGLPLQAVVLADPSGRDGAMPEIDLTSPIANLEGQSKQSAAPTIMRKETDAALDSDQAVSNKDATEGSRVLDPPGDVANTSKSVKKDYGAAGNDSALEHRASASMAREEGEQKSDSRLAREVSPKHSIADSAIVGGDDETDSQVSSDSSTADSEINPE